VPGAVGLEGVGPTPEIAESLDGHLPARGIGGRRRKYFIFVRMIWNFSRVCNPERQLADHWRDMAYELPVPPADAKTPDRGALYVHVPVRLRGKAPRWAGGDGRRAAEPIR